ncbi:hypothetical protein ACTQ32_06845 [Roseburia faecis]|uniref:hypothetical protein n=1 Tax=Roseburia faecis TaxID=301302 RepID=UPI000EBC11F9|nr:hypothetical protein [Lachnospiraceae bacterium]MDY6361812.1 hypothetical protein [Lachnospiraceae bacterium]HCJ76157.1 hypothetical protein [Roseburia sp.]
MKSGAINIDRYAGGQPDEQFNFLYENFSILQELLKDYREDLITEVGLITVVYLVKRKKLAYNNRINTRKRCGY